MSEIDGIHWTYKTVCVEPSTKVDASEALKDFAVLLNDDLALHFDRGWEVVDVTVFDYRGPAIVVGRKPSSPPQVPTASWWKRLRRSTAP